MKIQVMEPVSTGLPRIGIMREREIMDGAGADDKQEGQAE
jgi:hypothetical protein